MEDTKVIRVEKHHYHHHRRPPAKTVYVPQVRTEYVPQTCDRPHRSAVGTGLMVIGGVVLLSMLFGRRD